MKAFLLTLLTATTASAFSPIGSTTFPSIGQTSLEVSTSADTISETTTPETSTTKPSSPIWFAKDTKTDDSTETAKPSLEQLKAQILQLGAAMDRGQAYNPTSGVYYSGTMVAARMKIQAMLDEAGEDYVPKTLEDIQGEWELVLTTVPHGIFRSSPFFLAVQEAFAYGESTEAFGQDKANLFFKLHELQTCSWGVSKVGRVAQRINPKTSYLYSEFDTSIFSLTVIPILGWFKLLPTFGGCVVTASKCELKEGGKLDMVVDYTTSRPVTGLSGLGEWIWSVKVPVGQVWKLLPWNKGREANCGVVVRFVDDDFRIVEDKDGEMFVYTRPVVSRSLDLFDAEE